MSSGCCKRPRTDGELAVIADSVIADAITLTGAAASRQVDTDASKKLKTHDLVDYVTSGDTDRVSITDDAAGGVSVNLPNHVKVVKLSLETTLNALQLDDGKGVGPVVSYVQGNSWFNGIQNDGAVGDWRVFNVTGDTRNHLQLQADGTHTFNSVNFAIKNDSDTCLSLVPTVSPATGTDPFIKLIDTQAQSRVRIDTLTDTATNFAMLEFAHGGTADLFLYSQGSTNSGYLISNGSMQVSTGWNNIAMIIESSGAIVLNNTPAAAHASTTCIAHIDNTTKALTLSPYVALVWRSAQLTFNTGSLSSSLDWHLFNFTEGGVTGSGQFSYSSGRWTGVAGRILVLVTLSLRCSAATSTGNGFTLGIYGAAATIPNPITSPSAPALRIFYDDASTTGNRSYSITGIVNLSSASDEIGIYVQNAIGSSSTFSGEGTVSLYRLT